VTCVLRPAAPRRMLAGLSGMARALPSPTAFVSQVRHSRRVPGALPLAPGRRTSPLDGRFIN
jgi:hypothetical protein